MGKGVLPSQAIEALLDAGAIKVAMPRDGDQVQPSSLDLRLGAKAYRVRASFLPGPGRTVEARLESLSLHTIDLTDGAVLETGCVYI
ncbi:MAG: 2'-deoxycytidine 5'-triphosphate deaminase, partial [Rhodobiaceae bacterium]|nr:2'-deoxycytidine 5'-triphosphate deaminase [Rhodobiaceae bacterium]